MDTFFLMPCVSLMLLRDDDHVLLLRRSNTGYADGYYGFPGGGVEDGETFRQAAAREALEEVDVLVRPEDMQFLHVIHHFRGMKKNDDKRGLVHAFFLAQTWQGQPYNKEAEKHDLVEWFKRSALPTPLQTWTHDVLLNYPHHEIYSEVGWQREESSQL